MSKCMSLFRIFSFLWIGIPAAPYLARIVQEKTALGGPRGDRYGPMESQAAMGPDAIWTQAIARQSAVWRDPRGRRGDRSVGDRSDDRIMRKAASQRCGSVVVFSSSNLESTAIGY